MPENCTVHGCSAAIKVKKRRLCSLHYERQRIRSVPKEPSLDELQSGSVRDEATGCLVWTGAGIKKGVKHSYAELRSYRVHRKAYEFHTGEKLDTATHIDHMCHNTRCIEPTHLRAVTPAQNAQNLMRAKNNTSGMRGVTFKTRDQVWEVSVQRDGVRHHGGVFKGFDAACRAATELRSQLYTHVIEAFS